MRILENLIDYATENNISVIEGDLKGHKAASIKEIRVIGVDANQFEREIDKAIVLNQEIGHHMTQSFYTANMPLMTKGKCEWVAKGWSVRHILPLGKLKAAVDDGCRSIGELSERFELPHTFIADAISYYARKGML